MHQKQTLGIQRTMDLDLKMWRPSGPLKEEDIKVSVPIGFKCRVKGAVVIVSKNKTVPTGQKGGLFY